MNFYNYPILGLFTNNPNDVRGLEYYYNNDILDEVTNTDIINFIISLKNFSKILLSFYNNKNISFDNINFDNFWLKKWYYDFYYINLNEFEIYKELYKNIKVDDKEIILNKNSNQFSYKFIIHYIIESVYYYLKNIYTKIRTKYNITNFPSNIPEYKLDDSSPKFFSQNNNFNVNNFLSEKYKYIQFYSNKTYPFNNIFDINKKDIYNLNLFTLNNFNELSDNKWCKITLNISDKKKCNNLVDNLLRENNYGKYSKELFENDNNFKLYPIDIIEFSLKQNIDNILQILIKNLNFKLIKYNIKYIPNDLTHLIRIFKNKKEYYLIPFGKFFNKSFIIDLPDHISHNLNIIINNFSYNKNKNLMTLKIQNYIEFNKKISDLIYKCNRYIIKYTNYKTTYDNNNIYIEFNINNLRSSINPLYKISNDEILIYIDEKTFNLINKSNEHIIQIYLLPFAKLINKFELLRTHNFNLYFIESFENWKQKQNLINNLNKKNNLIKYLKLSIDIINKSIFYLNPHIGDLYNLHFFLKDNLLNDDNITNIIKLYINESDIKQNKFINKYNSNYFSSQKKLQKIYNNIYDLYMQNNINALDNKYNEISLRGLGSMKFNSPADNKYDLLNYMHDVKSIVGNNNLFDYNNINHVSLFMNYLNNPSTKNSQNIINLINSYSNFNNFILNLNYLKN